MKINNFYDELDLKYPEIAICIEDTETNIGKFMIPILTPMLNITEPYIKKHDEFEKTNIINGDDIKASPVNLTNYIEMKLPKGYNAAKKDDKFIVVFIGGDINKPVLIGGYE